MTAWVLFISAGLLVVLAGYLSLKNISEELDREYEKRRRPVRQPVNEGQRRPVRQPVRSGRTVALGGGSVHGRRKRKKSRARFWGRACVLFLAVGLTYYFVSRSVEAEDDMCGKIDIISAGTVDVGRQIAEDRALRDEEPPVIRGVRELTMTAGGSVSYKKGVTVTDNRDRNVELTVDSSAVDTLSPGDYNVIYIAVDSSGNRAVASSILHVLPVTVDTVTEEVINAEADKLLATILKNSMSQYEKAEAIYNWCHSSIAYSDGTPKTNWVQGAYRGIVERKGDCYTYAAAAKCLLTRAGIANMDIEKIPANSMHYWNLIDIGEGWHHFDTCRRKDGSTFFYKTDAELMEYSDTHGRTHNYDRSLYPEIS